MIEDVMEKLKSFWHQRQAQINDNYQRTLPFGDYIVDRWEKARLLNFGEGTSIYDSVIVIGDVQVGKNTWIGPFVVLDGSGGLEIGSNCSIAAGVQIYSHDSVNWAIGKSTAYDYAATKIGNNCYIGPNAVISKGVSIGNKCIIGANSLVLTDITDESKAVGTPCKIIGKVV